MEGFFAKTPAQLPEPVPSAEPMVDYAFFDPAWSGTAINLHISAI
jgi:hypothetical protein